MLPRTIMRKKPPYQLVEGDGFNLCLGLLAASALAACKHLPPNRVPPFIRWQLNCYTNWNLVRMRMHVKPYPCLFAC